MRKTMLAAVATVAIAMGCATPAPDAARRMSVVYDESTGVRILFDRDSVKAERVACYDGAPENRCFVMSCPGAKPETTPRSKPAPAEE